MSTSAATSSPRESVSIPALDGLRGVAVIGVLLFHDDRLKGGFLGVDLFFALSGMLITGLLIDEMNRRGGIDLRRFWSRRFRRLLPALAVMLAAVVPMMYWWGSPSQLHSARHGALPGLFYLSNWQQIRQHADYWALFSDPAPLTHLWSLAVEAQFYVAWPLLFVLIARRKRWRVSLGVFTAAAVVTSGALMWVLFDRSFPTRSYVGTDTRAASILAGAMVAIIGLPRLVARFAERHHVIVEVGQVAVVAGLAWSWITVDGSTSVGLAHGGMVLHSCACAVLAASLGLARPTVLQRVFALKPLRAAGLVSYGWYLWHWPVYLVLNRQRTGPAGWGLQRWETSVLRWAVSLGVAVASYYVVEMPVRRRQVLRRRLAAPAAFGVATVAVFAAVVAVPRPATAPAAFDPSTIGLPTTTGTSAPPATSVATSLPPSGPTTVPPSGATTAPSSGPGTTAPATSAPAATTTLPRRTVHSVLWEGDSVAFDSAPGVEAALRAAGLDASDATFLGLGLVPNGGNDSTALYLDAVRQRHPDLVVLQISGWDRQFSVDQQRAAFDTYTAAVLGMGIPLVFLTPPPVDPAKETQDIHVMLGFATALEAQHPDQVWVLDAAAALWGPFAYDINGDGVPERKKDGVHVCPQGSALLGNWLAHELARRFDGVTPAAPATWAGGDWVHDPRFDNPPGTCH